MKTELYSVNVSEKSSELVNVSSVNALSSEFCTQSIVYNEMSDFPLSTRSEVDQLQENAMVLRDLSDRLGFLSKEIKYLLNIK
ncbi:MAG: hypothetical protein JNL11_18465 [Bdellovibrionaceae bacterium]|nr:hypothetical protein [Pseudobdellovibrionaceae bacterium]